MTQPHQSSGPLKPSNTQKGLIGLIAVLIGFAAFAAFSILKPELGTSSALLGSAILGVIMIGVPLLAVNVADLLRNPNPKKLKVLDRHVVRVEDGLVVERNRHGEIVGRIDPSGSYRVVPNTIEEGLGWYVVTQNDQQVEISTRAPQAERILRDILKVTLWPPGSYGPLPF